MQNPNPWRIPFATAIILIAVQQVVFSAFMPVILPWPADLVTSPIAVWAGSIILAATAAFILIPGKARPAAIYMGLLFLLLFIVFHIPNQFITTPAFLGSWNNAFKLLALSGCAFIIASSFPQGTYTTGFEKIIPAGRYLLAITMLVFGIEHFIYIGFVPSLIPRGIPYPVFWTYVGGIALIAAGAALILNIRARLAAMLLGIMIFIWFVLLHIPRAMVDPRSLNGNEIVSALEALAFSSSAFILARVLKKKA